MFSNPINMVFDKLISNLNESQWLTTKRQTALKTFQGLGFPTRKSELWKYTDVKRLEKIEIARPSQSLNEKIKVIEDGMVVIVNNDGFVIQNQVANGVSVEAITEQKDWNELKTDFDRAFVELNTAMLNSALRIDVAKNSQAKIQIIYSQSTINWNNVRVQFQLAENSKLDLVETYADDCLLNQVSVFNLDDNCQLNQKVEKILSSSSSIIHYTKMNCADNVSIQQSTVNKDGYLAHGILDVDFNGEYSNLISASANLSEKTNHIADHIHVNHIVPNCKSEVIKRSLANDKGQVSVNAKAIVSVAADGSDIAQSMKNILMTDDAKIYSKPELEINTDDVVAAHGSTIGELDDLALSYLRSRGITYSQAQKMLIESFLQDANLFNQDDFIESIGL